MSENDKLCHLNYVKFKENDEETRKFKMGKDSENKAERILTLYTRLKQGKVVCKEGVGNEYNVSPRTIQRDIADIQCFLQNQEVSSGNVSEIVFDKKKGGYVLRSKINNHFEAKEALTIIKVLLESRSLMKEELIPIIRKILDRCNDEAEAKIVEDLIKNEMYHYVELQHGKLLLDRLWQLEQAVKAQKYIEIKYQKLKNHEVVVRKVKPVGIMFSEFYFYLTAYIDDIDKEAAFQNPDDTYPTIYRVDRLLDVKILDEQFRVPYAERFEEGEFRKRVQFMYGGKLRKIHLQCDESVLEAVLDRLPTAKVLGDDKNEKIISAEVFGNGIDWWIEGQKAVIISGSKKNV